MAHPDPGSLEVDSNSLMQTAQRLNKTKQKPTKTEQNPPTQKTFPGSLLLEECAEPKFSALTQVLMTNQCALGR